MKPNFVVLAAFVTSVTLCCLSPTATIAQKSSVGSHNADSATTADGLPIGFSAADVDGDKSISKSELKTYLDARLGDVSMPHRKLFHRMDVDGNGQLSSEEFGQRHAAIMHFMGRDFFGGSVPDDPGKDFVPYQSADKPIDDKATFAAVLHRYMEMRSSSPGTWVKQDPGTGSAATVGEVPLNASDAKPTFAELMDSSVIIAGGGDDFFSAGAVIISKDGLALTNYHVVEGIHKSNVIGMTADGKCHRVIEYIAGDPKDDVALIRLEGTGFKPARIARTVPPMASDIVMLHHSENRFFTYDRGYVMRYSKIGDVTRLEISSDYAPGASGCGIFNSNHELVGLVSSIDMGDGPTLAEGYPEDYDDYQAGDGKDGADAKGPAGPSGPADDDEYYDEMEYTPFGSIMVKHAVPLSAIHSLWSKQQPPAAKMLTESKRTFRDGLGLTATFEPQTASPGDTVTLVVNVDVPKGCHIYGAKQDESATKLVLDRIPGLTAQGTASIPEGKLHREAGKAGYWIDESITLRQKMVVSVPLTRDVEVSGRLEYTLCDTVRCKPPGKTTFTALLTPAMAKSIVAKVRAESVSLADSKTAAKSGSKSKSKTASNTKSESSGSKVDLSTALFDAPIALQVDGAPLNAAGDEEGRIMYPSPSIFDVDNDGVDELVVGEIFGTMTVFERSQNDAKTGDVNWSSAKMLERDGKPIELNNW